MANITESSNWEAGVYQFEVTDPLQGGADGVDNLPHKQLANRTLWLKAQVDTLNSLKGKTVPAFSASVAYAQNEVVSNLGNIWRANSALAAGAWKASDWTALIFNVDATTLNGQAASYYLDLTNSTGTLPTARLSGTYSIAISGNAATASKLATARTITLTGDVTGSASFDGSANLSITAVVADDSHNHVVSNIDGLQTTLDDLQTEIDGIVQPFYAAQTGSSITWLKLAELTTAIGDNNNDLTLFVSGLETFGASNGASAIVRFGTRNTGHNINVYRLFGGSGSLFGYVVNATSGKTELWIKRQVYCNQTTVTILNNAGATIANTFSSTEPVGIVYVGDSQYNFALRPTWSEGTPWDSGNLPVSVFAKKILDDADAPSVLATIGAAASGHTHQNIVSLGTRDPEINRSVLGTGVYTFSFISTSANKPSGVSYGSVIAFGQDTGGSAEIAAGWGGGTDVNYLGFRSLRDNTDSWYAWKRIYHEGYKPTIADINTLQESLDKKLALTGNAASATKLYTARTITLAGDVSGSASFDGTENITITAVVADNSHSHTSANISDATSANVANMIVKRDASGNVEVNNLTAVSLKGNASTASALQTACTINNISFNGSANITVEPYVESDTGTAATRYLTFVDSSTAGYQRLNTDTALTYNPSTNVMSIVVSSDVAEVGKVSAFARSSAPSGYLKCNGAAISRTTYSALFAAIGTTFGLGDGSTTFNIPDLRGEFIRGWDDARGVDTSRVFGSWQGGQNVSHTHTATVSSDAHTHTWSGTTTTAGAHQHGTGMYSSPVGNGSSLDADEVKGNSGGGGFLTSSNGSHAHTVSGTTSSDSHTHTVTNAASGGTEVRVRNRAMLYCIKY